MARPSEKPDNLVELVDEYLTECQDEFTINSSTVDLPTIEGFALKISFHKDTLYEWAKTDKEFSDSLGKIKQEQKKRVLNQGLAGNYNSTIAKLILAANHGMSDKAEIDNTHKFPTGIDISFIQPKDEPKE